LIFEKGKRKIEESFVDVDEEKKEKE